MGGASTERLETVSGAGRRLARWRMVRDLVLLLDRSLARGSYLGAASVGYIDDQTLTQTVITPWRAIDCYQSSGEVELCSIAVLERRPPAAGTSRET